MENKIISFQGRELKPIFDIKGPGLSFDIFCEKTKLVDIPKWDLYVEGGIADVQMVLEQLSTGVRKFKYETELGLAEFSARLVAITFENEVARYWLEYA